MNFLTAIANRLFNSIHLTSSPSRMLSFSPKLHEKAHKRANPNLNEGNVNKKQTNNVLKSEPLSAILPKYSWSFLAFKLIMYIYMISYLPRALYVFSLMLKQDEVVKGANFHLPNATSDSPSVLVKSSILPPSTLYQALSTLTSSSFSSSAIAALRNHLYLDPVLSTHALTNSIFSYLLVLVSFGLMTLYTLYLDYIVFFRSVQFGALFREAAYFHVNVPLIFSWRRPLSSMRAVIQQAIYLKRTPLPSSAFSWSSFSSPSMYFDRLTISRAIAVYQVMNVVFSAVLLFFASVITFVFFFVMKSVLMVLGGSGSLWRWQSQWILSLATLDQLITCYIAWNGARISIAGVEAFLGSYYATSRQVELLDQDQARLLASMEAIQRQPQEEETGGFNGSCSSNPLMIDCFFRSLALYRRQHRRLVVFAEALNKGLISPVLVATFLLNCLVNAAVLGSFIYVPLTFKDIVTNLSILWFQVVNIGTVCTLCVRYSKVLYQRLTPLSLRALNLSGPQPLPTSSSSSSSSSSRGSRGRMIGAAELAGLSTLGATYGTNPRTWNKGFRVERLKQMAFYEGLHQKAGTRGRFNFTVGPVAHITTKAVAEFCIQYIGYLLFTFSFIRDNHLLNKEHNN